MFNKPDAKSPHEAIYYYDAYRLNAIRSGQWKLKFQTNLEEDYGYYTRDTVIVTPPPRVEYRGRPPVSSYIWIDGYWNWVGHRHDWVPGYWAPPGTRPRAVVQHRQFERHRPELRRA